VTWDNDGYTVWQKYALESLGNEISDIDFQIKQIEYVLMKAKAKREKIFLDTVGFFNAKEWQDKLIKEHNLC